MALSCQINNIYDMQLLRNGNGNPRKDKKLKFTELLKTNFADVVNIEILIRLIWNFIVYSLGTFNVMCKFYRVLQNCHQSVKRKRMWTHHH